MKEKVEEEQKCTKCQLERGIRKGGGPKKPGRFRHRTFTVVEAMSDPEFCLERNFMESLTMREKKRGEERGGGGAGKKVSGKQKFKYGNNRVQTNGVGGVPTGRICTKLAFHNSGNRREKNKRKRERYSHRNEGKLNSRGKKGGQEGKRKKYRKFVVAKMRHSQTNTPMDEGGGWGGGLTLFARRPALE